VSNLAKTFEAQLPTGAKGNVLDPMFWLSIILGFIVLIVGYATAQNVGKAAQNRFSFIDATPDRPWNDPIQTNTREERRTV
jgi:hypothetical protein